MVYMWHTLDARIYALPNTKFTLPFHSSLNAMLCDWAHLRFVFAIWIKDNNKNEAKLFFRFIYVPQAPRNDKDARERMR